VSGVGRSNLIWLFYYDAAPTMGLLGQKRGRAPAFANPVKTDLPNGAHVKYFEVRIVKP
jgi:hypothetical protein